MTLAVLNLKLLLSLVAFFQLDLSFSVANRLKGISNDISCNNNILVIEKNRNRRSYDTKDFIIGSLHAFRGGDTSEAVFDSSKDPFGKECNVRSTTQLSSTFSVSDPFVDICSTIPSSHESVSIIASLSTPRKQSDHSSMILVNTMMFFLFTTIGSSQPFMPIYYRKIGMPDSRIGILGALNPLMIFLVSPLWGAFADKTGWYRGIMLTTFLGSLLSRLLLAFQFSNFVWLCIVVTVSAILNAPVKPLMDTVVLSMLKDKSDYGKSRIYGQMGFGVGSFIAGQASTGTALTPLFMAQAILGVPTTILMTLFQPQIIPNKKSRSHLSSDKVTLANEIVKKEQVLVNALSHITANSSLFTFFLLVGISCGIIETFAYVRLTELGGTKNNCIGISRLISTCFGGPMFYLSGRITKSVGVNRIMAFSLLSYIIRFMIYASVTNPWHALPAEALRGISFATFWSGCSYYVSTVSPKGMSATMLGILNGVYNGLGQSVGSLVGGILSKKYGIVKTFKISSLLNAIALFLFGLQQIYINKFHNYRTSNKENNKK